MGTLLLASVQNGTVLKWNAALQLCYVSPFSEPKQVWIWKIRLRTQTRSSAPLRPSYRMMAPSQPHPMHCRIVAMTFRWETSGVRGRWAQRELELGNPIAFSSANKICGRYDQDFSFIKKTVQRTSNLLRWGLLRWRWPWFLRPPGSWSCRLFPRGLQKWRPPLEAQERVQESVELDLEASQSGSIKLALAVF